MKQLRLLTIVLFFATLFLSIAAQNGNVPVVTDSKWFVFKPRPSPSPPMFLGLAQHVCLNSMTPLNCSMGVSPPPTLFGWPYNSGWEANNSSSLPTGARWIWAPNITGATTPANLQEFVFETDFYVCDPPVGGTISFAADNSAEVSINGMAITGGASTRPDQLTTFTVPANVLRGSSILLGARPNKIVVTAGNGDGDPQNNYLFNPAGMILGGRFEFMGTGECNGFSGTFKTGESETISPCPAGQSGSGTTRICVCGVFLPATTSCAITPPPTPMPTMTPSPTPQPTAPPPATPTPTPVPTPTPPSTLNAGAMCATNRGNVVLGTCPDGTSCTSRVIPAAPRPGWCATVNVLRIITIIGIFIIPTPEECNPKPSRTTDWFCDPG